MITGTSNNEAESPLVAVIVLNWNNWPATEHCVHSILNSTYRPLLPIIVDNASQDDSAARLKSTFPNIDFVQNEKNLGFAAGCNRGIARALSGSNCRYVLLANNDCRLAPSSIGEAVREAKASDRVGLVTPKLLFDEKSGTIWHAGGSISTIFGRARSRGFGERDLGQYDHAQDTSWATGALMLISREVVNRVGLLCEEYFFGLEEWDYSLAVARAGYRIRYCPTFLGYHAGDGSHENFDPRFIYNYYRNKLIFQERQLGRTKFLVWRALFRVYVELWLRRHSQSLSRRLGVPSDAKQLAAVKFAARSALQDHGRNKLSEETLLEFGSRLKNRGLAA